MAEKTKKSKFFRVATEGATTDGRKIERKWLQEIAASFNPLKYGARIFIEHIRGVDPKGPFPTMGDVVAVKTEEVEDGKLALFAQIEPTDEMVEMIRRRQKIYTSIEVQENFASTGLAYLVGLGVTDSPASLGTEVLAFAAKNPDIKLFATRKQSPDNVISAAEETTIEFEDVEADKPSLYSRVMAMFSKKQASDTERFADMQRAIEEIAQQTVAQGEAIAQAVKNPGGQVSTAEFNTLKTLVDDLHKTINHTAAPDPTRPAATGGDGAIKTDC